MTIKKPLRVIFNIGFLVLLMVGMVLFLAGCSLKKQDSSSQIYIYYLNTKGTSLTPVAYEFQSTDGVDAKVDELLAAMQKETSDKNYEKIIPDGISVMNYLYENHILKLYFNHEYTNLTGFHETMVRAAIVKTMLQIEGVNGVEFYVSEVPLTDSYGRTVGTMTADTFIDEFDKEQTQMEETNLTLYYATLDGKNLVKVNKNIHYNSNLPLEQKIMEYLTKDPSDENAKAPLSSSIKIYSLAVSDGICYVSIDGGLLTQTADVTEQVAIYSIVNSLCELDDINKVKITVEDNNNVTNLDSKSINGVYESNEDLVLP